VAGDRGLAPRERNKTLTALAGAEPVTGTKLPAVQRLQFFLSESVWDPDRVNGRRLELLLADPLTAPHGGGVLVIDDSGDRKDGTATAHVGRQRQERPGIPHQAADRRGPGRPGEGGGVRVPGGGRRQCLRGPGRVPRRTGRGGAAVRDGAQAAPGDLGLPGERAHPG
jgi:hypothetical protein